MTKKILLVEDDPAIRMAIEDDLNFEGYSVDVAETGPDGLEKGLSHQHDLIILDLMLPGGTDGLDICKELRRKDIQTPIIMLTAKSQDYDKVIGLELGADDYVTKPYSPHELRARVKAVLRRTASTNQKKSKPILQIGALKLDITRHECHLGEEAIILTTLEVSLLRMLMENQGLVVPRLDILDQIWGPDVLITPRTIDSHIGNLRKKICTSNYPGHAILSIRGVGYKLSIQEN
ncbi:MAG: response regulator transcription factor [Bacteroidetes bacterium]|jgi:DNA-binding response OmpR family regulator|nr:response regulator transcription factor [Bacteroidota bacterium]MBT5425746.1 response regulator transcription factor [Bacteroidota bacterium]MBT7093158.1 response regulator transcription factor [Bacteroidota bacterium]MBT7465010.1 response regulator transcription factor [Bacteroidota bacterium]